MKTAVSLILTLVSVIPAGAQVFRPEAAHRGAHGGGARHVHPGTPHEGRYIYRHAPAFRGARFGHEHGHRGFGYRPVYRSYGYYSPAYHYYPGYGIDYPYYRAGGYYSSGSAAGSGLLLGALAGGIIGNNSGEFRHNAWRGAAWGAGLGWLLGSVTDANRRGAQYDRAPAVVQQIPAPAAVQPAAPAAPQQVTIINNYYSGASPMSGANSLFGR